MCEQILSAGPSLMDMAVMRWSAFNSIKACPSISCWAKSSTYSPQPGRFLMKSQTSVTFHLRGLPRRLARRGWGAGGAGAETGGGGTICCTASFVFSFFSGGSRPLDLMASFDFVDPGGRPGPRLTCPPGPALNGLSSTFSDFLRAVAEIKKIY